MTSKQVLQRWCDARGQKTSRTQESRTQNEVGVVFPAWCWVQVEQGHVAVLDGRMTLAEDESAARLAGNDSPDLILNSPQLASMCRATLVGDLLVVLGGSGKATWSLKEVCLLLLGWLLM